MPFRALGCILLLSAASWGQNLFDAIRNNDLAAVRAAKADVLNAPGRLGMTPLMHAAAFGSVEAVKILLDAGADPKAQDPRGGTALHYGAWDVERVRLLVAKGADVNAASKAGRTPILSAASSPSGAGAMKFLLDHGADPKARDRAGFNLLIPAAAADASLAGLLIDKGLDLKLSADEGGFTPLHIASGAGNLPSAKLLLSKGANPNAANTFGGKVKYGDIQLKGITPLMLASTLGTPEMVNTLLDAGANVNAQDVRGMTPLMYALSTENQNVAVAKVLIARGAKLDVKSGTGETVADWVHKFNRPESKTLLGKAPLGTIEKIDAGKAAPAATPLEANTRAVALLQRTSTEFFNKVGCPACHHTGVALMAVGSARAGNVPVDEANANQMLRAAAASSAPIAPGVLQGMEPGGGTDTATSILMGLAAGKHPADSTTDSLVHYLAVAQLPNGSWDSGGGISRAPMEETSTGRTALAVRALQAYRLPARATEFNERIAKARQFLLSVRSKTAYEESEKLLGLKAAGASEAEQGSTAKNLLKMQHGDGGFSQNPSLPSDAYATGIALWALSEAGVKPGTRVYQRGVRYLVQTQRADGSWYVASRSPKFQPYFESSFPYGHDQWISAAATAYASIALSAR